MYKKILLFIAGTLVIASSAAMLITSINYREYEALGDYFWVPIPVGIYILFLGNKIRVKSRKMANTKTIVRDQPFKKNF